MKNLALAANSGGEAGRSHRELMLATLVAFIGYWALARFGSYLSTGEYFSIWWPAAGLALALVLMWGRHCLPGIFLASLGASLYAGVGAPAALSIALGATVAPLFGAWLLRREVGGASQLIESLAGVAWLLGVAYASGLMSALIGVSGMALFQDWPLSRFGESLATWMLGDALGVLSVTPLLITLRHETWPAYNWLRWLETSVVCGAVSILAAGTFVMGARWLPDPYLQAYLLIPLMIIAALRLPVSLMLALTLGGALAWMVGVLRGVNPIGAGNPQLAIWLLHGFMVITWVSLLLLSAMLAERRQAQRDLRSREAHFRALTALSSDGYWELDSLLRVRTSTGLDAWGVPSVDDSGWTDRAGWPVTSQEDDDPAWQALRKLMQRREPFRDLVLRGRGPDGRDRHVRLSGEPLLDEQGRFAGYRGVSTDVSVEREAQQAVKRSEAQLRALVDALPDLVVLLDDQGRWRLANRALLQMWDLEDARWQGLSTPEVLAQLPIQVPGDVLSSEQEAVQLSQGKTIRVEQMLPQLEGAARTYDLIMTPMADELGAYAGAVVIARDITHLKQSERIRRQQLDEIQRLNAELETRVKIRTAALEAANRELEAFSYSVSHDLRAPLRSLDGFSRMLLEDYGDKLDDTGADYLQRIRRNSQRMGELIDDLLKLSRVSRAEVRRQLVNLSGMAQDILGELADADPDRQVTARVEPGLWVDADAGLVRALLENLLRNAWKFSRNTEGACIEFFGAERNHQPLFVVRDNGVGFDMAYATRLFSPFQRLHGGGDYEGSGIGLAIVQRIVRLHGGTVFAEAKPGMGASFYFSLG